MIYCSTHRSSLNISSRAINNGKITIFVKHVEIFSVVIHQFKL